jgi:hypothetical protein
LATAGRQSITVTDTANDDITGSVEVLVRPAPAAVRLRVLSLPHVLAGVPAPLTVVAIDADGRPVPNYTGTVHFSSSDAAATLPEPYTFTTDDRGSHVFRITLATAGRQTVTVTDRANGLSGTTTIAVEALPVATQFRIVAPRHARAGVPIPVTVIAVDARGRPVPTYTGTVHFSSTDSPATLPADYTFERRDFGFHVFRVTLATAGEQTVTATDTANPALTGKVTVDVAPAPVATRLRLLAAPHARANLPVPVVVVALDSNGRLVPNYTGTVHFSSSDRAATLPPDYTFVPRDFGFHFFWVTFATPGEQTLTVTDIADRSLTAAAEVTVHGRREIVLPDLGLAYLDLAFASLFRRGG